MRTLLSMILLTLLVGCASRDSWPPERSQGDPQLWARHQSEASLLDSWHIQGKIGIRSPQDSGSGSLIWQQNRQSYDIRLSGPLGRGALRLSGRPGAVLLESAQGRYAATSAEELVDRQLGWQLPVSDLLYWIRGLPAPDGAAKLRLNRDSRLADLRQDDWRVEYLSYATFGRQVLPQRLKLSGRDVEVLLVIKDWQAAAANP